MSITWEDERYIRFYTRDTTEWLYLSWQARGLFGLIMRRVDRAGILHLGRIGLKGLSVHVHAPFAEIENPLNELLADGCVQFNETQELLLIPNFMKAQEAPQSDRARKQMSREKARARAELQTVLEIDAEFQENVTSGHDRSQSVTLNRTSLNRTEPSCAYSAETSDLQNPAEFTQMPFADAESTGVKIDESEATNTQKAPENASDVPKLASKGHVQGEPSPRKSKGPTEPPDSFELTETDKRFCELKKVSEVTFLDQAERCFDWHRSNGKRKTDWHATVRNWVDGSLSSGKLRPLPMTPPLKKGWTPLP